MILAPALASSNCTSIDLTETLYMNPLDTSGAAPHVELGSGHTLQIYNAILSGGNHNGIGGTIHADEDASVLLHDTVIYSSNAEYGGAIGFVGEGVLEMNGSRIEKSHASEQGGAIYMGAGSTFEMSGGAIGSAVHWWGSHNVTAGKDSGAIHLSNGASAKLTDGAEVIEGVAGTALPWPSPTVGHGGCIGGSGTVNVWGATVRGCAAPGNGGGIRAQQVSVRAGSVHTNEAGHNGGGIFADQVFVSAGSTVGVAGGANTAENDGGAIYATTGVVVEHASVVRNSHADRDGGSLWSASVVVRDDAVVRDATAGAHGGCIWGGDTTLQDDAEVTQCAAGGAGGAVRASGTMIVRDAASIHHGESVLSGGLVHVAADGGITLSHTATLSDGETDGLGGLVSVSVGGTLLATANATLLRGTAGSNGGLIYLAPGASGTLQKAAALSDGVAGSHGGLIRHAGLGSLTIRDSVRLGDGAAGDSGGLLSLNPGTSTSIGSVTGQVVLSEGTAVNAGGAIHVLGTPGAPSDLLLEGATRVRASSATDGGGIAAEGADVGLRDDVIIGQLDAGNTASGEGGGIHMRGGLLHVTGTPLDYPTSGFEAPEHGVRVEHNEAGTLGGGIALVDEALMVATRLVVNSNQATGSSGSGGGIAVDSGSTGYVNAAIVAANTARRGGGVFAQDESAFLAYGDGPLEYPCDSDDLPSDRYCTELTNNEAVDSGSVGNNGGGLAAHDSTVILDKVALQGNIAGTNGTAMYLATRADVNLTNVLVVGTNDAVQRSVLVADGANMDATMSTFAGEASTIRYNAGATGVLHGITIWPDSSGGNGLVLAGSGVSGGCNVGLGVGSLSGASNLAVNPVFVTTLRGKYRLSPSSPAVDHCGAGPDTDLDGFPRPLFSDFDAGAFENPDT